MNKKYFAIAGDIHFPYQDDKAINAFLDFIASKRIDTIILNGDILDFYDVSSFDKRPDRINSLQKELDLSYKFMSELRAMKPESDIIFIKGNHCLDKRTEVLTTEGWINIKDLVEQRRKVTLLNYNIDKDIIVPDEIVDYIKSYQKEMFEIETRMSKQIVSSEHQVLLGNEKVLASDIYKSQPKKLSYLIKPCGLSSRTKQEFTPDEVELITWVVTDGCIVQDKRLPNKKRIQFKLSKPRKIEALKELLDRLEIKYSYTLCKKTGLNKLQPYYIRVYGEYARDIFKLLDNKKQFPKGFRNLQGEQFEKLIQTIVITDGSTCDKRNYFYNSNKSDIDIVQEACIKNGYAAKVTVELDGGFVSAKPRYVLMFQTNYKYQPQQSIKKINYEDYSYCLTTTNGTLITRIDGKVAITGNCFRMERYLMKHPELYSLNNLKLPNLLRLDELGIEYQDKEYRLGSLKIIHGDMVRKFSGYTARGELEKHDCSGVNSHTHRLSAYYYKTPERYLAWFEAGCLCDINPEYVDNPNWQQGFLYGYIEKDSFAVTPIPIVDGKIKCVFNKDE